MASRYDDELRRGALVNLIGLVAKLVYPLFFLLVTWLFGPAVFGVYVIAVFVTEVAISAVSSGYNDATLIFASRAAEDEDRVYRVLGNGFGITAALSLVLLLGLWLAAEPLVTRFYSDQPALVPALQIAAWSLPFTAVAQVGIAATKARMRMEYDAAINGFLRPLALLAFSFVAWLLDGGVVGLMAAHVATQALLAVATLWAVRRHFDLGRVLRATAWFTLDREMLRFAIPQNLNMTFNRYLTRLDVLMLGAFGFAPEMLAFYAAGALITTNIREVKLIFSQALGPVAARHHAAGDRAAFEEVLGRVSRWSTTIAVPVILAALVLREDLLRFVDPSYTWDSRFMAVLLIPPFLSCAYGLAGNCIVFTGHSVWNLFNSVLVAGLNTVFNYVLIRDHGLLGAAVATALASAIVAGLQLVELRALEGVWLRPRAVWKPHAGLTVGLLVAALLWDPASFGNLGARIALAAGLGLGYAALMVALRHEELNAATVRRQLQRLRKPSITSS